MRDLIISGGLFSDEDKANIMQYRSEDVENLYQLYVAIYKAQKRLYNGTDHNRILKE